MLFQLFYNACEMDNSVNSAWGAGQVIRSVLLSSFLNDVPVSDESRIKSKKPSQTKRWNCSMVFVAQNSSENSTKIRRLETISTRLLFCSRQLDNSHEIISETRLSHHVFEAGVEDNCFDLRVPPMTIMERFLDVTNRTVWTIGFH